MTFKIILTCCAIMFVTAICCGSSKEGAKIKFEQTTHDFGNIPERGGQVYCDFKFTNTGDKPLVIMQATTSCGCTAAKYPKNPIAPGESGEIKLAYNPFGRPGAFRKEIKVTTNGQKKKTTLYIIGNTIPAGNNDK